MRALCALLLFLLPLSFADQQKLTSADTRKLALAAMPKRVATSRRVTIELDREQSQCAIYHAYQLSSGPPYMTFTLGWWSVDVRTAEVWDDLNSKRVTNEAIEEIQGSVRKRLGVTPEEIAASISNPCYERYSK